LSWARSGAKLGTFGFLNWYRIVTGRWYQIRTVHEWWYQITTVHDRWYRIATGEIQYRMRLVPDSDSGSLVHKYQIAELVQEGWIYLEVKDYTWKIEALVHETFNLLAQ
jgi:hypothetical protein